VLCGPDRSRQAKPDPASQETGDDEGGPDRSRTGDLRNANAAHYQLCYRPFYGPSLSREAGSNSLFYQCVAATPTQPNAATIENLTSQNFIL
jgi:hypothetical protein